MIKQQAAPPYTGPGRSLAAEQATSGQPRSLRPSPSSPAPLPLLGKGLLDPAPGSALSGSNIEAAAQVPLRPPSTAPDAEAATRPGPPATSTSADAWRAEAAAEPNEAAPAAPGAAVLSLPIAVTRTLMAADQTSQAGTDRACWSPGPEWAGSRSFPVRRAASLRPNLQKGHQDAGAPDGGAGPTFAASTCSATANIHLSLPSGRAAAAVAAAIEPSSSLSRPPAPCTSAAIASKGRDAAAAAMEPISQCQPSASRDRGEHAGGDSDTHCAGGAPTGGSSGVVFGVSVGPGGEVWKLLPWPCEHAAEDDTLSPN